jgi:uncharacterized protein DUF5302
MADTTSEPDSAKDDEDELKRKFREALERKRDKETSIRGGAAGRGTGKVHGVHGPAHSKRSFRRKSGG